MPRYTITQNKIVSRGLKYTLVYPTTIISKESAVNKSPKREHVVEIVIGTHDAQKSQKQVENNSITIQKESAAI